MVVTVSEREVGSEVDTTNCEIYMWQPWKIYLEKERKEEELCDSKIKTLKHLMKRLGRNTVNLLYERSDSKEMTIILRQNVK